MLQGMYRDDADAAKLRIQTLEAKLTEQEAGLHARDAEIAELRAGVERLGRAGAATAPRRHWPVVTASAFALLALSGTGVLALRPSQAPPPPGSTGVPACDLYLARLETCAGGNPATQAVMRTSRATMLDGIRSAATSPEARAAIAPACTQALSGLESSTACLPPGAVKEDHVRSIQISSNPPGAGVTDEGVEVCQQTPCVLNWRHAAARVDHHLTVHKPGYDPTRVTVALEDEAVTVSLIKSVPEALIYPPSRASSAPQPIDSPCGAELLEAEVGTNEACAAIR